MSGYAYNTANNFLFFKKNPDDVIVCLGFYYYCGIQGR